MDTIFHFNILIMLLKILEIGLDWYPMNDYQQKEI